MTKRIILLSLILVLGLSLNIYAAEKTIAEEKWDNFLETANLLYAANTGELISSLDSITTLPLDQENMMGNLAWNNKMTYSLTDNLEISGIYNATTQKAPEQSTKYFSKRYYGSIKDKFITQGPLTVAIKGDANYFKYTNSDNTDAYTTFTINGTVYSNLALNKHITLYNNFNIASKKDNEGAHWFSKSLTNCAELNFNEHNTLRVLTWTSLNDMSSVQPFVYAIFRSKLTDNFTYILDTQNLNSGIFNPYIVVNNIVEFKTLSATVITAQFSTGLSAGSEKTYSLDAAQKVGLLTVKAGYWKNVSADESLATLSGGMKINFSEDCALGFEVNKNTATNADGSSENFKFVSKLSLDL